MATSWTAIVVTSRTQQYAACVQRQLELRQKLGKISSDTSILCIEDALDGVGSGGATLNALLVVAEYLSAKQNNTLVTTDVLRGCRILVMHMGRYFPYDPCGKSFSCLPLAANEDDDCLLVSNFDVLYRSVTQQLAPGSPPGLWVCSSDMMLKLPRDVEIDWNWVVDEKCCLCLAVPGTVDYASRHGVYCIDQDDAVADVIFRGEKEDIERCCLPDGKVPLVSGIVYFPTDVAEKLVSMSIMSPFNACTYLGADSGCEPLWLSFFYDILLCMVSDLTEDEFVCGSRSGSFGKEGCASDSRSGNFMQHARSILWKSLHGVPIRSIVIDGAEHMYLDLRASPRDYCLSLRSNCLDLPGFTFTPQVHSHISEVSTVEDDVIVINSVVEGKAHVRSGSTLMHCHISSNVVVGRNCFVYGWAKEACNDMDRIEIPDNTMVMGMGVMLKAIGRTHCQFVSMPVHTRLMHELTIDSRDAGDNCDISQKELFFSACDGSELPAGCNSMASNTADNQRIYVTNLHPVLHTDLDITVRDSLAIMKNRFTLEEYRLWKSCWRVSFRDVVEHVDYTAEFKRQQSMFLTVASKRIKKIMSKNLSIAVLDLFKMFVMYEEAESVLKLMDEVAVNAVEGGRRPDICARAFACIADIVGMMATKYVSLRSGPASNKEWKLPMELLEKGQLKLGVEKLAVVRNRWLKHPDAHIRIARHYEGAEQILIRHAVMSVTASVQALPACPLERNHWLVAECPARIDLAGGWSDTPPVCYEFGGAVVNTAVLIDGKRPIGAQIRRISEPVIVLRLLGRNLSETQHIVCRTFSDFLDYRHPRAPGALLKACFVLSKIVDNSSATTESLEQQLMKRFDGGFELHTWAFLPHGSGLGTSSILAAAVLKVVYTASGLLIDNNSLLHAVLMLEQMLTTGGGWQDQVGGVVGGFKITRSPPHLPLRINVEPLAAGCDDFRRTFAAHLKLIYTGKTRLARNLLQNVLRNWYTKEATILDNCAALKNTAEACAEAVQEQDLAAIGACINTYWHQKKAMAPGCEPTLCTRLIARLHNESHGISLAGAGGGGFMYVLLKEERSKDHVTELLREVEGAEDVVVYDVEVDMFGMTSYVR